MAGICPLNPIGKLDSIAIAECKVSTQASILDIPQKAAILSCFYIVAVLKTFHSIMRIQIIIKKLNSIICLSKPNLIYRGSASAASTNSLS